MQVIKTNPNPRRSSCTENPRSNIWKFANFSRIRSTWSFHIILTNCSQEDDPVIFSKHD